MHRIAKRLAAALGLAIPAVVAALRDPAAGVKQSD